MKGKEERKPNGVKRERREGQSAQRDRLPPDTVFMLRAVVLCK